MNLRHGRWPWTSRLPLPSNREIASVSKTFTGVVALHLLHEALMSRAVAKVAERPDTPSEHRHTSRSVQHSVQTPCYRSLRVGSDGLLMTSYADGSIAP